MGLVSSVLPQSALMANATQLVGQMVRDCADMSTPFVKELVAGTLHMPVQDAFHFQYFVQSEAQIDCA